MPDDVLFDVGPVETPAPGLSADQRRTRRQRQAIAAGYHPLLALMLGRGPWSRLHPNAAPEMCEPGVRDAPFTCGSCRFRAVIGWHSRSYPKCVYDTAIRGASSLDVSPIVSHGAATDVRAWWPACGNYSAADPKLSPDAARHFGHAP